MSPRGEKRPRTMSQTITITAADGAVFDTYLTEPPSGPAPAIVIIPSIMGVTGGLKETADRFASHGFIVAAIDPFSRQLPGPLTTERREEAQQRMKDWKLEQGLADVRATVARFKTLPEWNGKWALLGYCFGGRLAFVSLSRLDADGAVAFHGVGMHLHLDEAAKVTKLFSFHFGQADPVVPMETVETIEAALSGKDGEIFVYEGAVHGLRPAREQELSPRSRPALRAARAGRLGAVENPRVCLNLIGAAIPRREDRRFITGAGRYTDDVRRPNAAHAVVRALALSARARSARSRPRRRAGLPGVLAVLTAADYLADGHQRDHARPEPGRCGRLGRPGVRRAAGERGRSPTCRSCRSPHDRVRFIGEGVALVVAETAAQARDAAELVDVDYEPLDAVFDVAAAAGGRCAALLHAWSPATCASISRTATPIEVARIFTAHRRVVERDFPTSACSPPTWSRAPHSRLRSRARKRTRSSPAIKGALTVSRSLAGALGVAPERVHVVTPDVGGGFGSRT